MSQNDDLILEVLEEIKENAIDFSDTLESLALDLENKEIQREAFRHIHSLKGNLHVVGLKEFSEACHLLEDYLSKVFDKNLISSQEHISRLIYLSEFLQDQTLKYILDFESSFPMEKFNEFFDEVKSFDEKRTEKIPLKEEKLQFLIVDDEPEILSMIKFDLQDSFSCVISTAVDGELALAKCENIKFDFIISDYKMPKLNGIDFVKSLKNSGSLNHDTPAIILTGYSPLYEGKEGEWDGVYFLQKPFEFKNLKFFINASLLEKKKAS